MTWLLNGSGQVICLCLKKTAVYVMKALCNCVTHFILNLHFVTLCFMFTFFDNILLSLESDLLFLLVLRLDVLLLQLKLLTQRREATQFYFHLTQLQPEKKGQLQSAFPTTVYIKVFLLSNYNLYIKCGVKKEFDNHCIIA